MELFFIIVFFLIIYFANKEKFNVEHRNKSAEPLKISDTKEEINFYDYFNEDDKNTTEINALFEVFQQQIKPIEKYNTIKELFIKSTKHVQNSAYHLNDVSSAIYSAELSLHIFALFIANRISKLDNKINVQDYYKSIEFESFIVCIKEFLNIIIKNSLNQKPIDNETIKQIVITRINFIFKESDFEIRNFNFLNLCDIAIQNEEENIFYIGSDENLRFIGGDPLNMIILPSAYKRGLIDEFLEKLKT